MTGTLQVNAAVTAGYQYNVTVGSNPALYGYSSPSVGSIAPNSVYKGRTIQTLHSPPLLEFGYDFLLVFSGSVVAKSYFSYLIVQMTSGVRVLTSASSTFTTPSGTDSQWSWGTGSSLVWGASSNGQVRRVIFY